jgi:hypothetical protein
LANRIKEVKQLDGVALSIQKCNGDELIYRAQSARELTNVMILLNWIGDSSAFHGKFSIVTEVET